MSVGSRRTGVTGLPHRTAVKCHGRKTNETVVTFARRRCSCSERRRRWRTTRCSRRPATRRSGRCRPATTPTPATRRSTRSTRTTSGDLQVAWTFSTGVLRGHEGSPLVIGNMMYVHTPFPNTVFALDLTQDGKIVWKYEPKQDPNVIGVMCCDTVYRGLAYADGMIFLHQADTTLVALDAKTGEVKWSVKNGDPTKGETNTATVLPVKDKVIVGISGGEFGVRGHVTAYNIADWLRWPGAPTRPARTRRCWSTRRRPPRSASRSARTARSRSWEGDQWQIGGGTTWGWYSYDPELDLFYYGTGNPSTWNPAQRPGRQQVLDDDLRPRPGRRDGEVALPDDAARRVGLRRRQRDDPVRRRGRRRGRASCCSTPDRNGIAYTLDRETGELLVAEKYDPAVNWTTGVDMDPNSETFGRPAVVAAMSTEQNGEDVEHHRRLPGGARHQGPAARGLLAEDRADVRADQPRLHGLRAVPGQLHRRPALCRRDALDVPGAGQPRRHGQLHRLGSDRRARSSGRCRSSSRSGRARWRPRATWSSTARSRAT